MLLVKGSGVTDDIQKLFDQNREWASLVEASDPGFFQRLAEGQSPKYLWIGCSDSRVPETQLLGLGPGDVLVHRNVANVIQTEDINCLSVIRFAIEVIKVRHIIVCGHYGCAGVRAGMAQDLEWPLDAWLRDTSRLYREQKKSLSDLVPIDAELRMCELNVEMGVNTIVNIGLVRDAWAKAQPLEVHGWIYDLQDGLIKNLGLRVASSEEADELTKN